MRTSFTYSINKTEIAEFELHCPQCSGRTTHKVLVSAQVNGSASGGDIAWCDDHQVVQCLGCKTHSFRLASTSSDDSFATDKGDLEYVVTEKLYPPRLEGIRGLGSDKHLLPIEVHEIYDETFQALAGQLPILTGIGLRTLLETVCKEKAAKDTETDQKKNNQKQKITLQQAINNLVQLAILTPEDKQTLHEIRELGNAAAHEAKQFRPQQLILAMEIVEHLLKEFYISPVQKKNLNALAEKHLKIKPDKLIAR